MAARFGQKPGSFAWVILLCSVAWFGAASAVAAELAGSGGRGSPSARDAVARPAATFFSINAVLAKLDRERNGGGQQGGVRVAAIAPAPSSATDVAADPLPTPQVGTEPFGLSAFRAPHGALWSRWAAVETDIATDRTVLDRCRAGEPCPAHAARFLRLIASVGARSGREQLEDANRVINEAIRYVSDLSQFGEPDRWSAALASLGTGQGDCEDYAIAKYELLREAGFPVSDMRLLLVRDRSVRQDHAVLAARLGDRWLILDNRWSELRDDTAELNFTPLFAIGSTGVHLLAAPFAQAPAEHGDAVPAPASSLDTRWGDPIDADGSRGLAPWLPPLI